MCFEEVALEHVSHAKKTIRADIVALPRDVECREFLLAFEVKRPDQSWHYRDWSNAIRQASNYVDAHVSQSTGIINKNAKISGAFIFPAPFVVPTVDRIENSPYIRPGFEQAIAGMFHLALHLRVGRAGVSQTIRDEIFSMRMGPNEVWNATRGFTKIGQKLLRSKRKIGSHG